MPKTTKCKKQKGFTLFDSPFCCVRQWQRQTRTSPYPGGGLARMGYDLGSNIPIGDIAGLRNRVSHDYEGVNWNILEDILFEDVPVLVSDLIAVMDERRIPREEIPLPEDS